MDSALGLGTLVFLCVFELAGGAALGVSLRGAFGRTASPTSWFFLIWGSGFAGIPLVIGAVMFIAAGQPGLFAAQVFVFLGAIVTAALMPDDLFQAAVSRQQAGLYSSIVAGSFLTLVGGGILLVTLGAGIGVAALAGGALAGFGVLLILRGVWGLVRQE